ncbi:hypothetical protein GCM10018962_65320 [Dactylosporangium matsuzakiense]|uniref:Uncharacterized protein n=1 Tax=Dactylosporangium matsuzakiense TaxID=53360 RepID=A0A9W6KLH5_9ACTN|nr:hypothetical protein GCM10017581_048030 [Dactylosporangium matsuzakiense]
MFRLQPVGRRARRSGAAVMWVVAAVRGGGAVLGLEPAAVWVAAAFGVGGGAVRLQPVEAARLAAGCGGGLGGGCVRWVAVVCSDSSRWGRRAWRPGVAVV